MSRDPWIGHPNYSWAYDDDDDDTVPVYESDYASAMNEYLLRQEKEANRIQERINRERAAIEPELSRERGELIAKHPVLTTGAIVGTALAKLFDGSLF